MALALLLCPLLVGARRVGGPFGCGAPIEPRLLRVRSGRLTTPSLVHDGTRTSSFALEDLRSAPLGGPLTSIGTLTWRADPNAYLDVFWGDFTEEGLSYAPMVRYEWPFDELTPETQRLSPRTDVTSVDPRVVFDTKVPLSLRFYDRGACSGELGWRSLGDALAEQLDGELVSRARQEGQCITPISNWVITPILRREADGANRDAFRFTRTYGGTFCNTNIGTTIRLTFVGGFVASDFALSFAIELVDVTDGFGGHLAGIEEALATDLPTAITAAVPRVVGQVVRLAPSLPPLLGCMVGDPELGDTSCFDRARTLLEPLDGDPLACRTTALCGGTPRRCARVCRGAIAARNFVCVPNTERREGGACAFVPNFHRLHERPEGIEIVLSEWSRDEQLLGRGQADALFDVLDLAGVCDRSTPRPSPQVGYLGSVFEVPPLDAPLPFGDRP